MVSLSHSLVCRATAKAENSQKQKRQEKMKEQHKIEASHSDLSELPYYRWRPNGHCSQKLLTQGKVIELQSMMRAHSLGYDRHGNRFWWVRETIERGTKLLSALHWCMCNWLSCRSHIC